MKCPHCLTAFHDNVQDSPVGEDKTSSWTLRKRTCPACEKFVLSLGERYERHRINGIPGNQYRNAREFLCYPKGHSRVPLGTEVPKDFSDDYREACMTLADSPKASAALSRRCLQHMLREKGGVKSKNFADEIQQVIDSGKLPSHLAESLDAVRNIGNFAAHPIKSTASGEIPAVSESVTSKLVFITLQGGGAGPGEGSP